MDSNLCALITTRVVQRLWYEAFAGSVCKIFAAAPHRILWREFRNLLEVGGSESVLASQYYRPYYGPEDV